MKTLPRPCTAAMEATIFTGWIYDHLLPYAAQVKVADPLMLRAIAAAKKKKNGRIDAGKIADCLRCDFLPERYMVSTVSVRPSAWLTGWLRRAAGVCLIGFLISLFAGILISK
jgi:transposase